MNIQSESSLVRGIVKIVNVLSFSALYLLCCIPAITAGAASISMSVTMRRLKAGEKVTYGDFLRGIKTYFRQGTILWLMVLVGVGVTVGSFYTYRMFDPISWPLYLLGVCMGTLCLLMIPWIFGCAGYFETDSGHMLVFAYYLSLKHLGQTFLFFMIVYGLLILGFLTVVFLPIVPGVIVYLQAGTFNHVLPQYEKQTLQVIKKAEEGLTEEKRN